MPDISFNVGRAGYALTSYNFEHTISDRRAQLLANASNLQSPEEISKFIKDFTHMGLWDEIKNFFSGGQKHVLLDGIALCHVASFPASKGYLSKVEQERVAIASRGILSFLKPECREKLFKNCSLSPTGEVLLTLPVSGDKGKGLRIPVKLEKFDIAGHWKAPSASESLTALTASGSDNRSVLVQLAAHVKAGLQVDERNVADLLTRATNGLKGEVGRVCPEGENVGRYEKLRSDLKALLEACGDAAENYSKLTGICTRILGELGLAAAADKA